MKFKLWGHSIKNPHIKHKRASYLGTYYNDVEEAYLCMPHHAPTPQKLAKNDSDVTCKNCLREMDKIKGL